MSQKPEQMRTTSVRFVQPAPFALWGQLFRSSAPSATTAWKGLQWISITSRLASAPMGNTQGPSPSSRRASAIYALPDTPACSHSTVSLVWSLA